MIDSDGPPTTERELDEAEAEMRTLAHRARMRIVDAAITAAHELAEAGDLRGPLLVIEGTHVIARIRVEGGRPSAILVRIE